MTTLHFFHSAILAFGYMEEELSTACRAAADALEILSNLRPGFTRNVIPRMNSTSVSVSQPNNGDRKVNNEELQSNELAIQSSTSPASNSSIQARLATLFPTIGSNRASGKSTSRRPARSKQTVRFFLILVCLFYVEVSVTRPVFHIWYCTRGFLFRLKIVLPPS